MTHTYENYKAGYKSLWAKCKVTKTAAADKEARAIILNRSKYEGWSVPWFVIGIIHTREAGSPPNFKAVLHNGESIVGTGRKTKLVPKNRGPFSSWREATTDALSIDHLDQITWDDGWGPEHVAWALEAFNGFGYRSHGIPSPYLWGGTNVQERGKYVSDGKYDSGTMDPQIGGMALLKELMALDPSVSFGKTPDKTAFAPPKPLAAPEKEESPELEAPGKGAPTSLPDTDGRRSTDPKPVDPVPSGRKKKSLWSSIVALSASVSVYFHQHWKAILVCAAVAGAIGLGVYIYNKRRRTSLSPKALEE